MNYLGCMTFMGLLICGYGLSSGKSAKDRNIFGKDFEETLKNSDTFKASSPEAKQALLSHLPALRMALELKEKKRSITPTNFRPSLPLEVVQYFMDVSVDILDKLEDFYNQILEEKFLPSDHKGEL